MSSTVTPQETVTTTSPTAAADALMPVTVTTLVLIGLAMAVTLLMIWWGSRLWRRSKASEADLEERGAVERVSEDANLAEPHVEPVPPAAADPIASEHSTMEDALPPAPPVAPVPPAAIAPPPLAEAPLPATPPMAPAAPVADGDTPLTILKGVGPKVAAQLEAMGIVTVADLAALDDARANDIDAQLGNFRGRMFRDRWLEQARLLAAGDRAGYEAIFGKLG